MTIHTPCIGVCSTVYGDDICRGCKRSYREVIDWNILDSKTRDQIWDRLNTQAEQTLNKKFKVNNPELFSLALKKYHIIQSPKHSQDFLILLLIRQAAADIADPEHPENPKNLSHWSSLGLSLF